MILLIVAITAVLIALALYLLRAPTEFGDVQRRDYALAVLRGINPEWEPPKPRVIEANTVASQVVYHFDDTDEEGSEAQPGAAPATG